jgi:hypothetical protein
MCKNESIWKLPRKVWWGLLLGVVWISILVYVVLHMLLRLPLALTINPTVAFSVLTVAFAIGLFWSLRYATSSSGCKKIILVVFGGYGVTFSLLCAYFAVTLNLLSTRDAFGSSIVMICIICLALGVPLLLRKSRPDSK